MTTYRIVVDPVTLINIGCEHQAVAFTMDWCRACSVSADLLISAETGLEIEFGDEWDGTRVFTAVARDDAARKAVARLIALAYEHPDPVTLPGWSR